MNTSMFLFAIDLIDEGFEHSLDQIQKRARIGAVSLAVAYHDARDILPHNPVRKVYYHEGDTVFFHQASPTYGAMHPERSSLVAERDILADLCSQTEARTMTTSAWTVYLHNTRLARQHPECATKNVFGDPSQTDLCPANSQVRRYAEALTSDICRYPVDSIMAESLHFRSIEHGYHHERYFIDLDPVSTFLFSLCFCDACMDWGRQQDVDVEHVRDVTREQLEVVLAGSRKAGETVERELISELASGEMAGYLSAREQAVSKLVGSVAGVADAADVQLTFAAHGGSARGRVARSSDRAQDAWTLGVDLHEVASIVDRFEILGYVSDTADLEPMVSQYLEHIGQVPSSVALRPMYPDTKNGPELVERVQILQALGVEKVDFYSYGLMPAGSLDWIKAAIA